MRTSRPSWLISAQTALVLLTSCATAFPHNTSNTAETDAHVTETPIVRQTCVAINRIRSEHHLPPLKLQETLCKSALYQAKDLEKQKEPSHTDSTGREFDQRIESFGYDDYEALAENIAAGQPTPSEVVDAWMHSPGHRANLLNPQLAEIGIGYAHTEAGMYHHFWVADFGRRDSVFPVIINNGEPQTSDSHVQLHIRGDASIHDMRISNDGLEWSSWEPFQSEHSWLLSPGYGARTVLVEVRNEAKTFRDTDHIEVVKKPIATIVTKGDPPSR